MSALAPAAAIGRAQLGGRVSWPRLAWVAPLTVVAAVAVCSALRILFQTIDPSLNSMSQLGRPMMTLAIEGSVAAVVVFLLFALVVPRPFFWFRVVGVVALVLSWLPDIVLGVGGPAQQMAMRVVGPLATLGLSGGGSPQGGAPQGGPPPGAFGAMPLERVLVLMTLHTAVAIVCIVMLTTLTRRAEKLPTE